jgi:tRNA 2-thiouridine synthesizing protein A
MHYDNELDARKLSCFMLTLRTKQSLDAINAGQVLKIATGDPGAVNEFHAFTRQTGHELLASSEAGGVYTFFIRKK